MGIRIYAYAVDIPRFDVFLDTTVGELFCRYSRDGNDPNERLTFTAVDNCDTFTATPKSPIRALITGPSGTLGDSIIITEKDFHKFPMLQQSAREHLSNGSIYQSTWLFGAFSNCRGVNFIERLVDGHRRWWVGSLLQCAQKVLESTEYITFELLFRRILRGYDCGYAISEGDIGFLKEKLPFTPENDPDRRFGRWCEDDTFAAVELLSKLQSSSPRFAPPPGDLDLTPDEWHNLVHQNLLSLLKLRDLNYEVCNVLTFIG